MIPGARPYQNIIKVEQHMSERTEIVIHVMSAVQLHWGNLNLVVNLIQFIVTFEFLKSEQNVQDPPMLGIVRAPFN